MIERSPSPGRSMDSLNSTIRLDPSGTAASRRRAVLQYLARFEYPVELRTLAAHVVAEERQIPVETVSDDERERTAIRLHHIDIRQLVAAGAIDYDPESRMAIATGSSYGEGLYEGFIEGSNRSNAT